MDIHFARAALRALLVLLFATIGALSPALATNYVFYNWGNPTPSGGNWIWTNNTNSAGPITATSLSSSWSGSLGSYTLPAPITTQIFTHEFLAAGTATGEQLVVTFPVGFQWGTGGMLVLGNVRDWYAYKLQAWDFAGNAINVNNWSTPPGLSPEYIGGTSGYVSTSSTASTASGNDRIFSVSDSVSDQVLAEGSIVPLLMRNASGQPDNVGKITVTLVDNLRPNGNPGGQDFFVLNVATPTDTGTLKLCKVAGPGVLLNRSFVFTIGPHSVSVPAGPEPGGNCKIGPALLQGSNATITETIPAGGSVSSISVAPAGRLVSNNLATGTSIVNVGSGFTEVTYKNALPFGYLEICKSAAPFNSGTFTFKLNGGNAGTVSVRAGTCSPAIQVPVGQIQIQEVAQPGYVMTGCSAIPASRQVSCILANRISRVMVVAGDVSTQTVANISNEEVFTTGNGHVSNPVEQ